MFAQHALDIAPLWPTWLIGIIASAFLIAIAYGTWTMLAKQVRPGWVAVLTLLRLLVLLIMVHILLQPSLSFSQPVASRPEILVLIDTSQSMSHPAQGDHSRLQEMLAVLDKGQFASVLTERFRPRWFQFASGAEAVDGQKLSELQAKGTDTRIATSLEDACRLVRAEGRSPRRILLVSDGNDRGTGDPAEVARQFGVTVDVLIPTAVAPELVSGKLTTDVQGTRRVLLGSETHFRLMLRNSVPAGKDRSFHLVLHEDGKPVQKLALALKTGRTDQIFTVAHRPASAGPKRYEFQILGADGQPAAPVKRLDVQVLDSKYEILLLEDSWRWEYRFLHRLFEDDPSFRFTALLGRGGKSHFQFGSPDRRVNLVGFPQSRAELEGFDIFFLGDVDPLRWPRGLAGDLAQLVIEEGKSLVVIAGPRLARLADIPELYALLPVDLTADSGRPVGGPVDVRLRADASQSPFFFQLATGDSERLPAMDQVYPVLRKRPGATVLVEAAKQGNAYGNLIVVAEHTVGRGRVLFVGTDTLWKWQTLAEKDRPNPYRIFWQQAFRALTPARLRLGTVNLWLTPDRTATEPGRKLELTADIQSDRALPPTRLQAFATLPDGARVPLAFAVDPANPRRFRAELSAGKVGAYKVAATAVVEGKAVAESRTSFEVEGGRGEEDNGVDRTALARLATATGGRVIDTANPESWSVANEQTGPAVQEQRTFDPWSNSTFILLLCGFLGTDWFIRLLRGYV
jgi:hypothetical protein